MTSPYAPGGEFGAEGEEVVQFADGMTLPRSMWPPVERERFPQWCGEPQFAEEARRAAKGQVTASGQAGFAAPPVKAIDETKLARAFDAVNAARDRLMRSRREE